MAGRGRNDQAIVDALSMLANVIGQNQNNNNNNNGGPAEFQGLDRFQQNNPPSFKGVYDPEGALMWMHEIEKIFRAMGCNDQQKVSFGTFMLTEEAEHWWENCRQRMEAEGTVVTWDAFKGRFFEKYFPTVIRDKKEMDFLALKQGDMSVGNFLDLTLAIEKVKKQPRGTILGVYLPRAELGEYVANTLENMALDAAQLEALEVEIIHEDPNPNGDRTNENQRKKLVVTVTNYLDLEAAIKKTILSIFFADTMTERVKLLLKRRAADNAFFEIEY